MAVRFQKRRPPLSPGRTSRYWFFRTGTTDAASARVPGEAVSPPAEELDVVPFLGPLGREDALPQPHHRGGERHGLQQEHGRLLLPVVVRREGGAIGDQRQGGGEGSLAHDPRLLERNRRGPPSGAPGPCRESARGRRTGSPRCRTSRPPSSIPGGRGGEAGSPGSGRPGRSGGSRGDGGPPLPLSGSPGAEDSLRWSAARRRRRGRRGDSPPGERARLLPREASRKRRGEGPARARGGRCGSRSLSEVAFQCRVASGSSSGRSGSSGVLWKKAACSNSRAASWGLPSSR